MRLLYYISCYGCGWIKPKNDPAGAETPKIREMGFFHFPKFRITCIIRNNYNQKTEAALLSFCQISGSFCGCVSVCIRLHLHRWTYYHVLLFYLSRTFRYFPCYALLHWFVSNSFCSSNFIPASISMRLLYYISCYGCGWIKPKNDPAGAETPKIREMGFFHFPKFRITCIIRNNYNQKTEAALLSFCQISGSFCGCVSVCIRLHLHRWTYYQYVQVFDFCLRWLFWCVTSHFI